MPGLVDICPICYADQTPKETKKGGYKFVVLGAFLIIVVAMLFLVLRYV